MERLQKRLARAGIASRRAAEDLVREGRVTVNGLPATLGMSVADTDDVRVDGRPVQDRPEAVTFALYKPRGVVTTAQDELGRTAVLDRMPSVPGLHPVGRLDRDSEGLLLLTTDGDLTLRLTHPRYGHEKAYRVWVDGPLDDRDLRSLAEGIELEDGVTAPARVEPAEEGFSIVLGEGRNRQIRRMVEALGCRVIRLVRTRVGGLFVGDLTPGEYFTLNPEELEWLEHPERVPRDLWTRAERDVRRRFGDGS